MYRRRTECYLGMLIWFILQWNLELLEEKLKGNNAAGARFGTAIEAIGDVNKDGYNGMS